MTWSIHAVAERNCNGIFLPVTGRCLVNIQSSSNRGLGGYAPCVVVVLSNVFIMLSMLSDAMRTDESRVYSRIRG